jgi:hypothetical protein
MPPSRNVISFSKALNFRPSPALTSRVEARNEIDRWPIYRAGSESFAIEAHVGKFVLGYFFEELFESFVLEGDFVAACNLSGIGAEVTRVEHLSARAAQIVLGFHVFEVESELKNVLVLDLLRTRGLGGGQQVGTNGLRARALTPAPVRSACRRENAGFMGVSPNWRPMVQREEATPHPHFLGHPGWLTES